MQAAQQKSPGSLALATPGNCTVVGTEDDAALELLVQRQVKVFVLVNQSTC